MSELIRYQNKKNPKISGICSLEEFEAFDEKQALKGKYRIIERDIKSRPEKVRANDQETPAEALQAIKNARERAGKEEEE